MARKRQGVSEIEVVRWVADHVDDAKVREPVQAPSPACWSLLKLCREDKSFHADFMKNVWTKLLPARSFFDEGLPSGEEFDGAGLVVLVEKLRKVSPAVGGRVFPSVAPASTSLAAGDIDNEDGA